MVIDAHQNQVVGVHIPLVPCVCHDRLCVLGQILVRIGQDARGGLGPSHRPARRVIELRGGGSALGGSYLYEGDALITGWHSHEVHQIEYALHGVVEVETDSAHYLLPPQQAAWIPAGLDHQAVMNPDVKTVAVMFDRALIPDGGDRARILAVSPLIREMMVYALRWPIDRAQPPDETCPTGSSTPWPPWSAKRSSTRRR